MKIVRRSREELESYIAGYNAAVNDMIIAQKDTVNRKNKVRAILDIMRERRDFLKVTFGCNQIDDKDIAIESEGKHDSI